MINVGNHIDEQALSIVPKDLKSCLEKSIELICELKDIYGDLYLPPALEELIIHSCFITDRVLEGSLQGCINSLTYLKLWDIITITCITYEVLSSLTSLKKLQIFRCLLLMSIGGWDTHNNLEILNIFCCPNLTLKASVVANNCNLVELPSSSCRQKTSSCALNYLDLIGCMPSDNSFQNLVSLRTLRVWDCPTIVNPHISNMKSLICMCFLNCSNLILLRGLSELSEFNHLKHLEMIRCPKFEYYSDADKPTRLKELSINKLSQLEQLISRDGFSSLVSLSFNEAEEDDFSQEECEVFCYLTVLESIKFFFCKIRVLPNLSNLHTLRSVHISNCKNLTSLSELPPYVQSISTYNCNEDFTKSCRDPRNPNWKKISLIPDKNIR